MEIDKQITYKKPTIFGSVHLLSAMQCTKRQTQKSNYFLFLIFIVSFLPQYFSSMHTRPVEE